MLSLSVPFKAQPGAVASELCGLMAETFIQLCDCANYSVIVDSKVIVGRRRRHRAAGTLRT